MCYDIVAKCKNYVDSVSYVKYSDIPDTHFPELYF